MEHKDARRHDHSELHEKKGTNTEAKFNYQNYLKYLDKKETEQANKFVNK